MKIQLKILLVVNMLFVTTYSFSQTTTVNSLSALKAALLNSNQNIVMTAGSYDMSSLSSSDRLIECAGSNNTVDLTGVYVNVTVGSVSTTYIKISGDNNTWTGGEFEDTYSSGITEVTDFSAYNQDRTNLANGLGGDAVMQIDGDDNVVDGLKLTTRGSFPYGYGSIYGIGAGNTFGLDKRCGILVNSTGNTLENIEIQHRAFGHAIFFQSNADDNLVKNCLIEGRVRATSEFYDDNNSYDLPYLSGFLLPQDGDGTSPIPMDDVNSLCEDGIRSYGSTGSVTVEDCTVIKMRAGVKLYLASSANVSNTSAIDCGDVAFNMPNNGVITNSTGNFTNEELSDFAGNKNGIQAEWTIVDSPDAVGTHNIADISNDGHNLIFHRSPGPINTTSRAIVVTGNNSTIVNETEYRIILESGTSGNTVTSCGTVTDNGSNTVTQSSGCYTNIPNDIGVIQAEDYDGMSGIQTENCSDTGGGENVGYIDAGDYMDYEVYIPASGSYTINYRVASKNGGGSVELQENGSTKATTSIASTGNWQSWTTLSASIALTKGTQTLRLYAASGGWNVNWIELIEDNPIEEVTGVSFVLSSVTKEIGETQQLSTTVSPSNATDGSITYSSNNTSVATVNSNGFVTTHSAGFALIKVTTTDGGFTDGVLFTVNDVCGPYDAFTTIEAEDYCSMSGIDTETCSDTNGGENVGWIHAGDWLMFGDVDFDNGADSVDLRIASNGTGGTVELRLGSTSGTLIGTVIATGTGGYQSWSTFSSSIGGASGIQDLYLVFVDGGINLNWAEFTASPACATFSTIEAEDFDNMYGVVDEGANIGNVHNGDWTMYSNVDLTCANNISVRASSKKNSGNIEVRLGSTTGTLIGTVVIDTTGNWNTWVTSSSNISSVTGTYDVYLVFTGGSSYLFNLDWIEFSDDSSSSKVADEDLRFEETQLFEDNTVMVAPNPATDILTVHNLNSNYNSLTIYNVNGSIEVTKTITAQHKSVLNIDHLAPGFYIINLKGIDFSKTIKLIKN